MEPYHDSQCYANGIPVRATVPPHYAIGEYRGSYSQTFGSQPNVFIADTAFPMPQSTPLMSVPYPHNSTAAPHMRSSQTSGNSLHLAQATHQSLLSHHPHPGSPAQNALHRPMKASTDRNQRPDADAAVRSFTSHATLLRPVPRRHSLVQIVPDRTSMQTMNISPRDAALHKMIDTVDALNQLLNSEGRRRARQPGANPVSLESQDKGGIHDEGNLEALSSSYRFQDHFKHSNVQQFAVEHTGRGQPHGFRFEASTPTNMKGDADRGNAFDINRPYSNVGEMARENTVPYSTSMLGGDGSCTTTTTHHGGYIMADENRIVFNLPFQDQCPQDPFTSHAPVAVQGYSYAGGTTQFSDASQPLAIPTSQQYMSRSSHPHHHVQFAESYRSSYSELSPNVAFMAGRPTQMHVTSNVAHENMPINDEIFRMGTIDNQPSMAPNSNRENNVRFTHVYDSGEPAILAHPPSPFSPLYPAMFAPSPGCVGSTTDTFPSPTSESNWIPQDEAYVWPFNSDNVNQSASQGPPSYAPITVSAEPSVTLRANQADITPLVKELAFATSTKMSKPKAETRKARSRVHSVDKAGSRGAKPPNLACFFCRDRKIACGRPAEGDTDPTCSQCKSRSRSCQYPMRSMRGKEMREERKRASHASDDSR